MKRTLLVRAGAICASLIIGFSPVADKVFPENSIIIEAQAKKGKKDKKVKTYTVCLGATKKLSAKKVKKWKSSKKEIASVNKKGVVTPNKPGKATITAVLKNGSKTKFNIVVPEMKLSSTSESIKVGETKAISVKDAKNVKWSSSNPSVASVTNGSITGIAEGTAVITAAAGKASVTCAVSVAKIASDDNTTPTPTPTPNPTPNPTPDPTPTPTPDPNPNPTPTPDPETPDPEPTPSVTVSQPTITYSKVTRQVTRGTENINEELNLAKIKFNGVPANAADIAKITRTDGAGSEEDGKQDGKYITVACALAACKAYSEGRNADGQNILNALMISPHVSAVSVGSAGNLSYYFSDADKKTKLPWAFLDGATPSNNYKPTEPITVTVEESVFAPEKSTLYGAELSIEQIAFHTSNHPCLNNTFTVSVYKDPSDGNWYLWPSGFTALYSTASIKVGGGDADEGDKEFEPETTITQPTLTYKTIIRQATRNGINIDEEINQANIVFNQTPNSAADIRSINRGNNGGTTENGKQDGKYLTVACALTAMIAYSEGKNDLGKEMMDALMVSPHVSAAKVGQAGNLKYYFEYDDKKTKLPWAFFDGATTANNYKPTKPLSVTLEEYPYAPQISTIYGVELSIEKIQFHIDNHPCLKNNLTVAVYRDPTDGQWYLWPSGFASLVSTASIK